MSMWIYNLIRDCWSRFSLYRKSDCSVTPLQLPACLFIVLATYNRNQAWYFTRKSRYKVTNTDAQNNWLSSILCKITIGINNIPDKNVVIFLGSDAAMSFLEDSQCKMEMYWHIV